MRTPLTTDGGCPRQGLCNPLRGWGGIVRHVGTREALRFPFAVVFDPFGVTAVVHTTPNIS